MTDKRLQKLKKTDLLQLMLEQSQEIDRLREELDKTKAELADRRIRIANSGSVAEASLAVSKIFEDAQRAADLYLENVRIMAQEDLVVKNPTKFSIEEMGDKK